MIEHDMTTIEEDLEQFRREKEKIRGIVGKIGGRATAKKDKIINIVFSAGVIILFVLEMLRHLFSIDVHLPPLLSLKLGLLMVSIKILWMIYKQGKVEHFQFWVLNSIEFRIDDIAKRIRNIERHLK